MGDETLRATLESAVESVEKTSTPEVSATPKVEAPTPPVAPTSVETQKVTPAEPEVKSPTPPEPTPPESSPKVVTPPVVPPTELDAPPKSWKPTVTAKWAAVDPEIKAEINRREKEITKVFGETNQIREFHKAFSDVVRPYEAHLRNYGKPLEAISNLLQWEYHLSSAPPVQRAQAMAKLIKDYGVDIKELDSALAGEAPADPISARFEQLLEQKLSPLQQFIAKQEQISQFNEQKLRTAASNEIEAMMNDPTKYPHFEEVREDMADVIQLNAKRGNYITPIQAYERAVAMNPEWAAEVRPSQAETQRQQALAENAKAQKALQASSSVKSTPSSSPTPVNDSDDLRSSIEAAFNKVSER